MQPGDYTQSGGFDPGLAALISTLLTGGIGAYGYSKTSGNAEQEAADRLEKRYVDQYESLLTKGRNAEKIEAELKRLKEQLGRVEGEKVALQQQTKAIEKRAAESSGTALAFKNAKPDVLLNAAALVIAKMGRWANAKRGAYAWLIRNEDQLPMLFSALKYPASSVGRLARMSLPDFYTKRVKPAALLEYQGLASKGGRRRYRRKAYRGGDLEEDLINNYISLFETVKVDETRRPELDTVRGKLLARGGRGKDEVRAREPEMVPTDTPVAADPVSAPVAPTFPFPSYEEFSQLYGEAITEAEQEVAKGTLSAAAQVKAKSEAKKNEVDAKVLARKNEAAKKAQEKKDDAAARVAQTIIPKFEKAIQEGEKAIADNETLVKILSTERQASIGEKKRELLDTLQSARELIGVPATPTPVKKRFGLFGGAATLREVKTEAELTEMNTPTKAVDLLQEVKDKTKAFVDEVKAMSKEEKKSFDVPKVEFGLPKIPIPSLSNPFAPIAKRLGEAKTVADQAAIVRKETKNAVVFMKDILKKVDTALNEVVLSEKATARRNRKKGGAVDPDAFKPRREMDGYDSLGIQALAANLKAVAKGGTETVGGKTFNWSEKPDGELHPLSFYLAQLNTSVFSGTVDLFIATTTGKPREFSRDVFVAAGEQYALVRTYLEDVVKGLKNPELIRATRLERIAMGAEEGTTAVAAVAATVVGGIMALAKKVSPALVRTMPGAPVPIAVTTDVEAKTKELIALHGVNRIKRVLTRLEAKIPSFPVEKQAGLIAVVEAAKKVVEEAEASGETAPPTSPEEVDADEEAVNEAVEEEPAAPTPPPFQIEEPLGPIPPGDFSGIPAPVGALPTAESPSVSAPVTPVSESSNPTTPTLGPQVPTFAPVKPVRAAGESEASWSERSNAYAASLVLARTRLRATGRDLTRGGRRRKARKSTLKKRRGGK